MSENIPKGKGKKGLKVLLIIISVLMLAGIGIGFLLWQEIADYRQEPKTNNYMVIAPELNVTEKDKKGFNSVETIPYGTIVELQRKGSYHDGKAYHKIFATSINGDEYKKKKYYIECINDYDVQETYYSDRYKRTFTQKDAQALPSHVKKALMDALGENTSYNYEYCFTQDANRMKSSIIIADFNMDDEKDVAVTVERLDYGNWLYVLCYNKDIKQSYVAFQDANGGYALIRPFNKNALIYMDSEKLVKAPNNGIIYESTRKDGFKYAVIYDPERLQFNQYYQSPLSKQIVHEYYYEEVEDYHGYNSDGDVVVRDAEVIE